MSMIDDWAIDVGLNPNVIQPVNPATVVTMSDGRRQDNRNVTAVSMGSNFFLMVQVTSAKEKGEKASTTNYFLPHMSAGRPVGWYLINPNELVTLISATQFNVQY